METQIKNKKRGKKVSGLIKDKETGEVYLTGFAEYYHKLQSTYKSYPEFEQARMKRLVKTLPESIRANFSDSWQH